MRARLALVLLLTTTGIAAAGAAPRVALVNVSAEGAPPARELGRLRAAVAARGFVLLPPGEVQAGLEGAVERPTTLADARALLADADQAAARFAAGEAAALVARAEAAVLGDELAGEEEIKAAIADVALHRAVLESDAGDQAAAIEDLRLLRRLDPGRQLDPAIYRPRLISLFERAAPEPASTGAGAGARLAIQSDPPGASIWLDGRAVGRAPRALGDLAPGPHLLALVAPGRRPARARIALSAGASLERSLALAELPPARRAQIARARLAERGGASAAGALAAVIGVDALVLVRVRGAGARAPVELAVYNHRTGRMTSFGSASARDALAGLGPAGRGDEGTRDQLFARSPARSRDRHRRGWYRTWWGVSILAVGATGLATGIYLIARDRSPESYQVSSWCLEDSCR